MAKTPHDAKLILPPEEAEENMASAEIKQLEGDNSRKANNGELMKLSPREELDKWLNAIPADMASLTQCDVHNIAGRVNLAPTCRVRGKELKYQPTLVLLTRKPLHDQEGCWIEQVRNCVWELRKDSVGKALRNRADVPPTCELEIMLALGTIHGWSVGSPAVRTHFLNAEL